MVMEMENPHKPVNKGKCKMKMYVTRYSDWECVRKCTVYPYVKVKTNWQCMLTTKQACRFKWQVHNPKCSAGMSNACAASCQGTQT